MDESTEMNEATETLEPVKKGNLVIVNKRPSLVTLPSVTNTTDARLQAGLQLLPGENDVPEWYWKKCLKVKAVKIWVAAKILINKGEGVAKALFKGLDSLPDNEAAKQIARCDEVTILKDWKDKSESRELQKLCTDKINEIVKAAGE